MHKIIFFSRFFFFKNAPTLPKIFRHVTQTKHTHFFIWPKAGLHYCSGTFRVIWHFSMEPVSSIRYKLACAYSEDLNQSVHSEPDQSLSFLPEEMLDHWLPTEHLLKTLIRLHRCAG